MTKPLASPRPLQPLGGLRGVAAVLAAVLSPTTAMPAPDAPESRNPIHLHRVGTGDMEGLKKGILMSVEACRVVKQLPAGGPVQLPSDATLARLAIAETDEYFDGPNHAVFNTSRLVWADPRSGSCELRVFHERHAWAGQECGLGFWGGTTLLGALVDMSQPAPPLVETGTRAASLAGCAGRATRYDTAGLAAEDAGLGVRCVWESDIIAKSLQSVGVQAPGHQKDGPTIDFCLYERQPAYVVKGHSETVVLKSAGGLPSDVMNQLMGLSSAYMNHQLVDFSDGNPIPAERFSPDAVRRFVDQPAITAVGEGP